MVRPYYDIDVHTAHTAHIDHTDHIDRIDCIAPSGIDITMILDEEKTYGHPTRHSH
jgi:hypothetical protein